MPPETKDPSVPAEDASVPVEDVSGPAEERAVAPNGTSVDTAPPSRRVEPSEPLPVFTPEGVPPEETRPHPVSRIDSIRGSLTISTMATTGLLVLASFYTLYLGRVFFVPVAVAFLLKFLLQPFVRALKRFLHLPLPAGAALVILFLLGGIGIGVYELAAPAARWVEQVPENFRKAELRLQGVKKTVEKIEAATEEINEITNKDNGQAQQTQEVRVQEPRFSNLLVNYTWQLVAAILISIFLLYFLMASGDQMLRHLVETLPRFQHRRSIVEISHRIEDNLSRYLVSITLINICLGTVVGFAFYLLGMPNPMLWGVLVAFLNFIPYVGALIGILIVSFVAIVSFDTLGEAVLIPLVYLLCNSLEAYVFTPMILGRLLTLNPVMIFLSLIFWGWIWGVVGAILAVPFLMCLKIVCTNIKPLAPIAILLER